MRRFPWLSSCLVILAHMAFGGFLENRQSSQTVFILAGLYIIIQAAILSIAWKPLRSFLLLGFKSDIGYTAMALVGASLAVVMVAWIQIFAYFLMMIAAALLLRIDLLVRNLGNGTAFIVITCMSLSGLVGGHRLLSMLLERAG